MFWCLRAEDRSYLLVAVRNGKVDSHIRWLNFPGGLTLAARDDWDLSTFHYVDDPHTPGPAGLVTEYRPIQDEYDGAVTLFYEHEGRWLFSMFH